MNLTARFMTQESRQRGDFVPSPLQSLMVKQDLGDLSWVQNQLLLPLPQCQTYRSFTVVVLVKVIILEVSNLIYLVRFSHVYINLCEEVRVAWLMVPNAKSAHTALAVKACLLGCNSATLNAQVTFVYIAVAISALAGGGGGHLKFSHRNPSSAGVFVIFRTIFGRWI